MPDNQPDNQPINLKKATLTELKALVYDVTNARDLQQKNLQLILQEIKQRADSQDAAAKKD